MGQLQQPRNSKWRRKSLYRFRCSECMYRSSRRYNVVRHEFRIHSASSRPRKCCDVMLTTKGEYYLHCEINHPDSRPTNMTSRKKYKILAGNMVSQSLNSVTPVPSSPKKTRKMPYMLRSRVRPKIHAGEIDNGLAENVSSKSLDSVCEDKHEDVSTEDRDIFEDSSGYGTINSTNSTLDGCEKSTEMELSYPEVCNEWRTPHDEQLPCLDNTSVKAVEPSPVREPSPIEFCKNGQITGSPGGNLTTEIQKTFDTLNVTFCEHRNNAENENPDETMDLTGASMYHDVNANIKISDLTESDDTKRPDHLPLKKQILRRFGLSNHENIANAEKPIGDRLRLAKSLNLEESLFRKKRRQSKKTKCQNLREGIASSQYASASSNAENVSPLTAIARSQKALGLKVDLRANGRFTWDETTRLMRDHLQLIDFDSFKAYPQ